MYDPSNHHRRSIRLKGYDYSTPGAYFVTVCVHYRRCLFGDIARDRMQANDGGHMIERWWMALPTKFPVVATDTFIVMPNHFHGVLRIGVGGARDPGVAPIVPSAPGAATQGRPYGRPSDHPGHTVRSPVVGVPPCGHPIPPPCGHPIPPPCGHPTLPDVMDWFKTMTTNEYIRGVRTHAWVPFPGRLWQRGYYERIIRDDGELTRVREYITTNPARWTMDRNNPNRANGRPDMVRPAPTDP